MTLYDFLFLCFRKKMMNNQIGFRKMLWHFENAQRTIKKREQYDSKKKKSKTSASEFTKAQPKVTIPNYGFILLEYFEF
jgi:hypothetical protein